MKVHKYSALLCAALVLLAGCASGYADNSPSINDDSEEVMEISVAYWNIGSLLEQNEERVKQLEKELHIRLTPVEVSEDDYDKKSQIWAQTNTFPDIFVGKYRLKPQFRQWVEEGLLREIPEDLSLYPALESWLRKEEAQSGSVNGKLYCVYLEEPVRPEETQLKQTVLYRADLAAEVGISEEPGDWQEFRRMVKYVCAADSLDTEIGGMAAESRELFTRLFLPYYNPLAAAEGVGFTWIQTDSSEYIPVYFNGELPGENMLPVFSLARLMYEEGSIAQDAAFISGSQAIDSFLHGKSAALCVNGSYQDAIERLGDYWKKINGGDFSQDVKALKAMPSMDGKIYNLPPEIYWSELYISSRTDDEKMERILILLDRLAAADEDRHRSISEGDLTDYDSLKLEQGREAQEVPSSPLCRQLYLETGDSFEIDVTKDLLDIMTGKAPVQEMWQERVEEYKRKGLDEVILKVNRAVKLHYMGQK